MSIYASIPSLGDPGDSDDLGAPWLYQGSHVLPDEDDPRGGTIGLALIPSHITRDGRDDQPENGAPWPWLRLSLDCAGDDPAVLLNPAQARYLAEQLTAWADSTHRTDLYAVKPDGESRKRFAGSANGLDTQEAPNA